ncbi:MAG TPA: DUF2061 domain-containing protein [Xanthomonadaceae bacterium]|nr:DUF2061 domain-containing protein [Xanthomonadaceae bacterium]
MSTSGSFALVHFTVAFGVTRLVTGSLALGGLVALIEPMANAVAYHVHEKAWIRFGQQRARVAVAA